jgi:hypothetical protein
MSSEVQEHVTAAADAETVVDNPAGPDYPAEAADSRGVSLFSTQNSDELRGRWDATQRAFVDDPRAAVEKADHLVVETIQLLSTSFTRERSQLEEQWARGPGCLHRGPARSSPAVPVFLRSAAQRLRLIRG